MAKIVSSCCLCPLFALDTGQICKYRQLQRRVGLYSAVLRVTAVPIRYTKGMPPYLLAYVEHASQPVPEAIAYQICPLIPTEPLWGRATLQYPKASP